THRLSRFMKSDCEYTLFNRKTAKQSAIIFKTKFQRVDYQLFILQLQFSLHYDFEAQTSETIQPLVAKKLSRRSSAKPKRPFSKITRRFI
ncbi:MAG: hypothetical protein MR279_03505, partial [Bacteroidales bacterium]|nr:hypothetical protein [Bacteroidales bacterium]